MKLKVVDIDNKELKEIQLPDQFNEPVSEALIKRAVLALQANARQKYGADPRAGKKGSTKISRRRHKYKGAYGHGISRVPRKILSRRGTQFNWDGALAPGTKGGRRAHPPKASKEWEVKINKKERRKAIRSALAATLQRKLVERHHRTPASYPFIVENKLETLTKTNDVKKALSNWKLQEELKRISVKKTRAGKGTMRVRRYRTKTGPLLVVSKRNSIMRAAKNLTGVEVTVVNKLNAEALAPGRESGRLTLFTEAAIERIAKEGLFV